jgi:branched-chain amino acid transport system ATP-binding protein
MNAALDVSHVSFYYGRAQVLDDVSFQVGAGEIVTIVGPNGAGKSTLLNVVARSHRLRTGDVAVHGTRTNGMSQRAVVRLGCVLVPEGRQVFSSQSVHDNLLLGGYTRRREAEHVQTTLASVYEHFPRLLERRDQLAGTLSGGEQQMLAIGRALMSGPRVMLLDEPSLGLAPQMTERIMRILGDLRQATGLSIVLVEQNARAALDLADRGYLLSGGRVVLEGSSADLKQDRTIQQIYLGGTASASAS